MKQIFIDFGPGKNDKMAKTYKAKGWHTVGIDYTHRDVHDSPDWGFTEMIYKPWHEANVDYKADVWRCSSCLEHTKETEIEESVQAIANLIKPNSNGRIHIDLTDHEGGFTHYEPGHKWTDPNGRSGTYLNTVRPDEWIKIMDKYFTYSRIRYNQKFKHELPTSIDFDITGVK